MIRVIFLSLLFILLFNSIYKHFRVAESNKEKIIIGVFVILIIVSPVIFAPIYFIWRAFSSQPGSSASVPKIPVKPTLCSKCGAELDQSIQTCPECGNTIKL